MILPEVTKTPCNECPWRRAAWAGHLGPHTAEEWVEMAHGEGAIACHKTIRAEVEADWSDEGLRQCAGAAQFRTNVFKSPRNTQIAVAASRDTETVFAWNDEFLDHHNRKTRS